MDTTIVNQRVGGETFEDYRARLKKAKASIDKYLKGFPLPWAVKTNPSVRKYRHFRLAPRKSRPDPTPRQYEKQYCHALTDYVTAKNLAVIANRVTKIVTSQE